MTANTILLIVLGLIALALTVGFVRLLGMGFRYVNDRPEEDDNSADRA